MFLPLVRSDFVGDDPASAFRTHFLPFRNGRKGSQTFPAIFILQHLFLSLWEIVMQPSEKSPKSILFVCWGNVCRSPAAEIILKRHIHRHGFENVRIASAGVCADGAVAHPSFSMWWASLRRGFWLRPKPRLLRKLDIAKYDLMIAMDRDVLFAIKNIAKEQNPSNVKLLSEFLPREWPIDVPDPMQRPARVCNRVLDMLETACDSICRQFNGFVPCADSVS